ncbi:hypothetical protein ACFPAF_19510 [Hymenobacter endophyticus]|uniref:Glycosyltransferase RgtA/B/C/D-like domain-containing protein n=1 Tax=Hymenobacter endophyticus TaxID=3076335 RepID=A0ABU3TMI8_9BACT|nr:hypothetical protein [Hymenobacter endophyticus]MDU0372598.1 hypothetical protein [Hymenobacter endophyticus]
MRADQHLLRPQPGRIPRWVLAGLVALHVLALGWQLHTRQPFFPDSDRYVQAARNLRDAGLLYALPLHEEPLQLQEYTIRPPGYPVFLLLTGGAGTAFPGLTLLLQNALSLLNLWLTLRWLARSTGGLHPWQWGAVLLLAVLAPAQFIYANVLMSETLLQTAVVVLWLSITKLLAGQWQRRTLSRTAVAAALALLIKPVFWPFAAVFLGIGVVLGWRRRRISLVAISVLPLLAASLWMARNQRQTGYFHFSSISEINLLRYNARGVLQAAQGSAAAEQFVRATLAAAERQPGFAAQQQYVQQHALAVLVQHPGTLVGQELRGVLTFFLDPGRFDVVHFLRLPQTAGSGLLQLLNQRSYAVALGYLQSLPLGLLAGLLLLLSANVARLFLVLKFSFNSRYPWAVRLGLVSLVLYVALLTGPLGAARFTVPVLPLLLAAAGAGLTRGQPSGPAEQSPTGLAS